MNSQADAAAKEEVAASEAAQLRRDLAATKAKCKELIDICGQNGGYIMDASAIMQNDSAVANVKAMTDFTREYGVYSSTPSSAAPPPPPENRCAEPSFGPFPSCFSWESKLPELPPVSGDPQLLKQVWQNLDGLAYFYIWHLVLSF